MLESMPAGYVSLNFADIKLKMLTTEARNHFVAAALPSPPVPPGAAVCEYISLPSHISDESKRAKTLSVQAGDSFSYRMQRRRRRPIATCAQGTLPPMRDLITHRETQRHTLVRTWVCGSIRRTRYSFPDDKITHALGALKSRIDTNTAKHP